MSYDIRLMADLGGPELVSVNAHDPEYGYGYVSDGKLTPTYNISPMFELALGHPLSALDGKRAGDTIHALTVGIGKMIGQPEIFAKLRPANGWGDTETALDTLRIMAHWAQRAPDAVWCI